MNHRELVIRNITLGSGTPKICVPIVETCEEAILEAAAQIRASQADLVEWRCDYYEGIGDRDRTERLLEELRTVLEDMPLLFTYRTKAEGGAAEQKISEEEYAAITLHAAGTGLVDLVDVEMRAGKALAEKLQRVAGETGCRILMSSHDFAGTPSVEEMKRRYEAMEAWGADVLKLAVMPHTIEDVLALLTVCKDVSKASVHPVVAIAMGSLGLESRILGEAFGSAMTFGCLDRASAPGQMEVGALAQVLQAIHQGHCPAEQQPHTK